MKNRTVVFLIAAVFFVLSSNAQTYQYEHQLHPKKTNISSFDQYAKETNQTFMKAYRAAGKPRILVLFDEKAIQDMGGLSQAGLREVEINQSTEVHVEGKAAETIKKGTATKNIYESASGNGQRQSDTLISFRDYIPTTAADWTPEKVGGFDRYLLEEALDAPLIDAGAVLVDRKTALDFHAEEIFSAMKRNRLESQRDALKKVADLMLCIRVNSTKERVINVSGDQELDIPAFSARIFAIADARLVDVISNRAVSRIVNEYDISRISVESRAEVLAYTVMNQLINYWNREKK